MQTETNRRNLSSEVLQILNSKGLSKLFNFPDYHYFKVETKGSFNQAQAIADLFVQFSPEIQSDFADYTF